MKTWETVRNLEVESFNKMLAKVKAVATNREEELELLKERVLIDLIQFQSKCKKTQQSDISKEARQVKKRKAATDAFYDEENAASVSKIRKQSFGSSSRSLKDEYEYDNDFREDDEEKTRKLMIKKKKKQKTAKKPASTKPSAPSVPSPPQELPKEFKEKIESLHGSEVKLVIQKKLFKTDLNTNHNRLSIPANQVINKNFLGQDDERLNNNGVVYVRVIDPCLKVHDELGLNKWVTHTKSSFSYALNKGWNSISTDKEVALKEGDTIQVWFFRVNNPDLDNQESLGFAVVKLKDVNGSTSTTDRQEAAESSMMKKDLNGCSSSSASASQEVIESSTTKKQQLEFGATRQHVSIKFRNVTLAKIETAVSVL